MANGKSNYFEEVLMTYFLGTSNTMPKWDVLYLALTTNYVLDSDDGTSISEVTGIGYERIPIYIKDDIEGGETIIYWEKTDDGERRNKYTIEFIRAQSDWGLIRGFALCTEKTGGQIIWHGTVYPGRYVETDEIIRFEAGDLIIRED